MAEFGPDIVDQVVEVCKTGAGEAVEAFGRALDAEVKELSVDPPTTLDIKQLPEAFRGAGLVVLMKVGTSAALVLLPESSGILPSWYTAPDPTGQSKLTTLAQELGMILLPEEFMPEDFQAAAVKNLAGALGRGGVDDGSPLVWLTLALANGGEAQAALVWPAGKPEGVFGVGKSTASAAAAPKPAASAAQKPVPVAPSPEFPKPAPQPAPRRSGRRGLPNYSRSLLRVEVPVIVTLAAKRQALSRVMELGPGSIIDFEKSCEEMLEMDVSGTHVAMGEAVKVGDKFGLRITSMLLPEERFHALKTRGNA